MVAHEGQMVDSAELDEPRRGDLCRDPAPLFDVRVAVAAPVQDERGHRDRRQHVADVDLRVHPSEKERRAGARRAPQPPRELACRDRVTGDARRDVGDVHHPVPVALDHLEEPRALVGRRRPRVVGAPDPLGEDPERDERACALRIRRREQHGEVPSLGRAEHGDAVAAGGVDHRAHVVHPFLRRRQPVVRHPSDIPVPRLSKTISRENDASRSRNRACSGLYHASSTSETQGGAHTSSRDPSPTTW